MPYSFVPKDVIAHVDDLRKKKGRKTQADAFRDMAQYAAVGRELEAIGKLSLKSLNLPPLGKKKRGRK